MPIARVTELSATSDQSFEDAINQGVNRATSSLRNVESAWIKDMNVMIENGNIAGYKVNIAITFVLEEGEQPGWIVVRFRRAQRHSGYGRGVSYYVGRVRDRAPSASRSNARTMPSSHARTTVKVFDGHRSPDIPDQDRRIRCGRKRTRLQRCAKYIKEA